MHQREIYFYTATIYQWKPLLKEFNLETVITQSLNYLYQKECIKVYGFVIMPNHVHFIWELLQNNGNESPVSSFMKFTAHEFQSRLEEKAPHILNQYKVDWHSRKYNFWQPKSDWFALNQASTIEQKLNYIHLNPMRGKWSLVNDPTEYYIPRAGFMKKEGMILSF